jgi:non-heme chloroperoxidase
MTRFPAMMPHSLAVRPTQERFFRYFAEAGYECFAVSLRGQGKSEKRPGMKASSLTEHVRDLANVIAALPRQPVLLGHSFGGLVVQR